VALTYFDFDLEIAPTRQGYHVGVHKSLAGGPHIDVPRNQVGFDLAAFLTRVERPGRDLQPASAPVRDPTQTLCDLGTYLFETFFAGEVGLSFRRSFDEVEEYAGLRIRLRLTGVPELAQWPWEYLYDPLEAGFVTLSVKTPLVRYLEVPQLIRPFPVQPPIKILTVIASPGDRPQLDVVQEWNLLQAAVAGLQEEGLVKMERLDQPTVPRLLEYLAHPYHILHFIGHGDFDAASKQGILLMETEQGRSQPVSTRDLRTLLRDGRATLRLVVLNACKGARGAAGDPFAGLAQGLIRSGIQAVIAMQFAITDPAAIDFARGFYTQVAAGLPIDEALGHVRKALYLKDREGSKLEWGTPVLFMRSPDGRVFDVAPRVRPAAAGTDEPGSPLVRTLPHMAAADFDARAPRVRVNPKVLKWFVNRDTQRRIFLAMMAQQVQKQIMLVEAPTHMGKTWLVNWLYGHCCAGEVPVAHFDFDLLARRPLDYLTWARQARDQLGAAHFGEMTELINRSTGPQRGSVQASGRGDLEEKPDGDDRAGHDNLGTVTAESSKVRKTIRTNIEDAFFRCLQRLSHDQTVVFLFDAYERAGSEAAELVDELLLRIRLDRLPQVLVVVAGQQVPQLDEEDFGAFLVPKDRTVLQLFSEEDVIEYLRRRELSDLDPVEIHRRANGHPRRLSLVVEELLLGL
jgi:hypothetical protein